jgi:hypothetical protein
MVSQAGLHRINELNPTTMNEVLRQIIIWIATAGSVFVAGFFIYWMITERQKTKAEYYAASNHFNYDRPPVLQRPFTVGWKKTEEAPLTKAESTCREILSGLQGETLWHYSIRAALAKGTDQDFRTLVCQLKSEAAPVPHVMKKILGVEAYESVMAL